MAPYGVGDRHVHHRDTVASLYRCRRSQRLVHVLLVVVIVGLPPLRAPEDEEAEDHRRQPHGEAGTFPRPVGWWLAGIERALANRSAHDADQADAEEQAQNGEADHHWR